MKPKIELAKLKMITIKKFITFDYESICKFAALVGLIASNRRQNTVSTIQI